MPLDLALSGLFLPAPGEGRGEMGTALLETKCTSSDASLKVRGLILAI